MNPYTVFELVNTYWAVTHFWLTHKDIKGTIAIFFYPQMM